MSSFGTLLVMFVAVHLVTGLYLLVHATQRGAPPEQRSLALLVFAAAFTSIGTILMTEARDPTAGLVGMLIRVNSQMIALPLLVRFQQTLISEPRPRVMMLAYLASACAVLVTIAILLTGPLGPQPVRWEVGWAPDYVLPRLSTSMITALVACSMWGYGVAVYSLSRLVHRARSDRQVRVTLRVFGLVVLMSMHDLLIRLTQGRMLPLLDIGIFFTAVVASRVMLDRFAGDREALGERRRQLERTREALLETEHALLEKKRLAAVGELAAVIAHEVRNPIAILKNAVSGMRRSGIGTSDRRALQDILTEETARLKRLVASLRNYTQPLAPQPHRVDIAGILRTAAQEAQLALPDKNTQVRFLEGDHQTPSMVGDPELLRLAFTNVIENALHASPPEGEITLALEVDDPHEVCVVIRDEGPGMDPETAAKAADPFFTTRPTGTGLGLAIVDRVVRAHGGRLEIDSAPGQGTRVALHLPTLQGRDGPATVRSSVGVA